MWRGDGAFLRLSLGIPLRDGNRALARRLASLTGLRLGLLTILLVITTTRVGTGIGSFSSRIALAAVAGGYVLSAVQAFALRRGSLLGPLAHASLLADQAIWTVFVYLTGGAQSGATSLYGLTCLLGAVLVGQRGAALAAVAGITSYAALAGALSLGVVPPPPDQDPQRYALALRDAAGPFTVNVLALVVVTLLSGYLAERLRLTGGLVEEATARAERAEQMAALGRLSAGMAHELRNPLGAIAASVELLRDAGGLSAEDRRLCEIIQREASRLNDLVTDMLELSRPRSPTPMTLDLVAAAREVVVLAARSGRGADVDVALSAPSTALLVEADSAQLRQLLWNLVRNAVQASSAGARVDVVIEPGPGGVSLAVRDHGPGIPEGARDRLFDAFYTTRTRGTGIGLAVVKRIVDDHRWSIEVDSDPGRGTTFRVRIPPKNVSPRPAGRVRAA